MRNNAVLGRGDSNLVYGISFHDTLDDKLGGVEMKYHTQK